MLSGKKTLITQGEYAVSKDAEEMISTLLGSCVAVCLWDERNGIGGMNHLLLASQPGAGGVRYDMLGVSEMEKLINGIVKMGGNRDNLQAKVFGGASMIKVAKSIGEMNSDFAFSFLEREGIPCINSDVGGSSARNLRFWVSGRVTLKLTGQEAAAAAPPPPKPAAASGNGMELF